MSGLPAIYFKLFCLFRFGSAVYLLARLFSKYWEKINMRLGATIYLAPTSATLLPLLLLFTTCLSFSASSLSAVALYISLSLTPPSLLCVALDANILSHASVRECSLPSLHGCSQWGPQSSGLQWSCKIKVNPQRTHPCVWNDSHIVHTFSPCLAIHTTPAFVVPVVVAISVCLLNLPLDHKGLFSLSLSLSFSLHLCTCLTFSRLWIRDRKDR